MKCHEFYVAYIEFKLPFLFKHFFHATPEQPKQKLINFLSFSFVHRRSNQGGIPPHFGMPKNQYVTHHKILVVYLYCNLLELEKEKA